MSRIEDSSKNIWIKEDPVQASRLSRHKDDYEDIIQERRLQSDFRFCTKSREVPQYKYNIPRRLDQLRKDVLGSDRVRYTLEQVAATEKIPKEQALQQARLILDEMAHNLNMTSLRGFAFLLVKVIKKLYQRVYVNESGIERVRALVQEYPVILMPTHRSYADFLILSYICYHYDLPLPVIAAAMDFMSMKFFGTLLRNCGAFFIRRSFGMDKLYWAVFTEYVQTHIENSDNPVEFYVEGTRSRTGKNYLPKQGMLSVVLEPFFKAQVPDVMIVPVSISYDRILEESLYAYEQLGIPKPKESTSGLLKARSVLDEDFGNIHLHFGEPISVRQYADGKIERIVHSLAPRYVYGLTSAEQKLCAELAYDIVLKHQQLMVISVWALIASVMAQNKDGIYLKNLNQEVKWLKRCTENLGGYIDWEGSESAEAIVRKQLKLHHNIVTVNHEDFVTIKLVKPGHVTVQNDVILNAATHIMVASYRNHVIHCFARVGIISTVINSTSVKDVITIDALHRKYEFLENVLCKDFIYKPGTTQKSFDEALKLLVNCGEVILEGQSVLAKKSVNKYSLFFSQMFEPFLLAYWVMCQYLLCSVVEMNGRPTAKRYDHVTREVQSLIVRLLQENLVKHYEMLSLNLLSNGLTAVTDMGAVRKERREKHHYVIVNPVEMTRLTDELAHYIEVPAVPLSEFAVHGSNQLIQAKL